MPEEFRVEGRVPEVTILFSCLWVPLLYASPSKHPGTLACLCHNQEPSAASSEYRFEGCESGSSRGSGEGGISALGRLPFQRIQRQTLQRTTFKSHSVFLEFCVFPLAIIL